MHMSAKFEGRLEKILRSFLLHQFFNGIASKFYPPPSSSTPITFKRFSSSASPNVAPMAGTRTSHPVKEGIPSCDISGLS